VATIGAGFIVIDRALVAVLLALSVTITVKLKVPAVVGVPEIIPVDVPSVRPFGRAPAVIDQVYGSKPPVAVRVWL
jgi:hypothetical protein